MNNHSKNPYNENTQTPNNRFITAYNYYKYGNHFGQKEITDFMNKYSEMTNNTTANFTMSTAKNTGKGITSWFNVRNSQYLKGALIGAGIAFLISNPKAQKALVSGAVRAWSAVQSNIEEIKEQIQDVKAESSQED